MKNIKKLVFILVLLSLFSPVIIFANNHFVGPCPAGTHNDGNGCAPDSISSQTCDPALTGIKALLCKFQEILNLIVPILVALGVVYFVWGVVRYVIADGEEAKQKGKDSIIYGIIGLAVIVGLFGLVNIVITTFGISSTAPNLAPLTGNPATCTISNTATLKDVLCYVTGILNDAVIPLIFAMAMVMFVWGAVNFFIINGDEAPKREQGRQFMIWGIIALAVMLSVWGLVGILKTTFGITIPGGSLLPQVRPPV